MVTRTYLTLIDPSRNANKHYFIAVVREGSKYLVRTAWGRVGTVPQEKVAGRGAYIDYGDALKVFHSTIFEKVRKGYTEWGYVRTNVLSTIPKWWVADQPPATSATLPSAPPPATFAPPRTPGAGKTVPKPPKEEEPERVHRPNAKWNF